MNIQERVPQPSYTQWHNPTAQEQRLVLEGPRGKFAFVVAPGETRELDGVYDRAVQLVDCGRDECHRRYAGGWYCTSSHDGVIKGGLAPLLQRVGKRDKLHPSCDPAIAEKKALEAEIARETLLTAAKEQAIVIAAQKLSATVTRDNGQGTVTTVTPAATAPAAATAKNK